MVSRRFEEVNPAYVDLGPSKDPFIVKLAYHNNYYFVVMIDTCAYSRYQVLLKRAWTGPLPIKYMVRRQQNLEVGSNEKLTIYFMWPKLH